MIRAPHLALLALAFAGGAHAAPPSAEFAIDAISYSMPVPAGLCLPSDEQRTATALNDARDTVNQQHASFYPCDGKPPAASVNMVRLKTPNDWIGLTVTRSRLMAEWAPALEGMPARTRAQLDQDAQDRVAALAGGAPSFQNDMRWRSHDDVCIYQTGTITMTRADGVVSQKIAMCMTTVGDRVIVVSRSAPADTGILDELMKSVRTIALSIRVMPRT